MTGFLRNSMLLALLLVVVACGRKDDAAVPAAAATPDGAIIQMIAELESNDIRAFVRRALSDEDYKKAHRDWDEARVGGIDPEDKAKLNAALAAIADEAVVDELMAEIGPDLEAARPNLPIMLFAAQTMAHASIAGNEALTEAQKDSANELLAALGKWAGGRDLANPELARAALTAWVTGARRLDLQTAEDLQALSFDDMVGRAGIVLGATKDMLLVYDLSIDAVLASTQASVVRQQGDTALVRVNFDLLDTNQQFDVVMIRRDGRWLPESLTSKASEAAGSSVTES